MADVPLFDVLSPYFFAGVDLGPGVHRILGLLHVDEIDAAWDDDAVVLSGVARIDSDDPDSFFFSPLAGGGAPNVSGGALYSDDTGLWEWHDLSVRFRLTVARQATQVLPPADVTDASLRALLESFGATGAGVRSDYPGTQFRLELLLALVTVALPGFRGAKLQANGMLAPDEERPQVKIKLPRILLVVEQGSEGPDTPFDVRVASYGATGLDGQSRDIANAIEMEPPYALFKYGGWGIGFRSCILDLDDSQTPPELLDKFGIGDDWQGLYLPEARLFVQPDVTTGLAVSAGVRDMLYGIRATPGFWGDVIADVVNQGDRLEVELRFYDAARERLLPGIIPGDEIEYFQVRLPDEASMIIDIKSGAAPYTIRGLFGRDARSPVPDDEEFEGEDAIALDVSQHHNISGVEQQLAIRITSRNPSQTKVLIVEVQPRASADLRVPGPTYHDVEITPDDDLRVLIASQTEDGVVLKIDPVQDLTLEVDGDPVHVTPEGLARVAVSREGGTRALHVQWSPPPPRKAERLHAFFEFRKPAGDEDVRIGLAPDPGPGDSIVDSAALNAFIDNAPSDTVIRIDGFASFEDASQRATDEALSLRRANRLKAIIEAAIAARNRTDVTVSDVVGFGHHAHPLDGTLEEELRKQLTDEQQELLNKSGRDSVAAGGASREVRKFHWRATASYTHDVAVTPEELDLTLHRDAPTPPERRDPPDVPPPVAQRPDWFRSLGVTFRVLQDQLVAFELRGSLDFHTAAEAGLEQFRGTTQPGVELPPPPHPLPERTNPEDGVVDFRLSIHHDDTTRTWTERLVLAAGAGDRDGLWSLGSVPVAEGLDRPPPESLAVGRDLLGLTFAMAPLLASSARDAADDGDVVPLAIELAIPPALVALDFARVLQFTLYGGEMVLKHHGLFEDGKLAVLLDVESALWLNLRLGSFRIVTSRPDKPVRVRYKAVGFTINAGFDGSGPFVPVFDASRGYTIDLADSGSLRILPDAGPLGDIVQLLGARIARTNPLNFEVELGLGVDLGVFTVDKLGFRLPIDPVGPPTLTGMAVSVDVPNTIAGRGELTVRADGMAGQLDVSLPAVGLRIAGGLGLTSISEGSRSATGVLLSLRAEYPTAIPLAASGLGIYGFLGMFAMHYRRNEPTTGRDRALRWLHDVVHGDPTDVAGWVPKLDAWSFGAGVLLGTMEGAYVVRMSGLLALELPGPRLLFFVKADLLETAPPGEVADERGTLLATLDIDFAAHTIAIAIQLDYRLEPVLELTAPVEGFFDTDDPSEFAIDVGRFDRPITARVFQSFRATAYLMVHGNGITGLPIGPLGGFSVAAGFHLSLLWGDTDIGLYVKAAAGFDAGVGFAPFFIAGQIYLTGELHLFVVGIECDGRLTAKSDGNDTWVKGEVRGSIDCFFFSISGSVEFELGTEPGAPEAPSLTRAVVLQSRSPALLQGTGIERGIDTVLCHATTNGTVPVEEGADGATHPVYVPIDSIPVVQMEAAPELASGFSIAGTLNGTLPGGSHGWRKRGQVWVRYRASAVSLTSPGHPDPVTGGDYPNTWRSRTVAQGGDAAPIDLALLDWSPEATPKAFEAGANLDQTVDEQWGNVCEAAAPPAPVMWTFHRSGPGGSPSGWTLAGEPWPDPPGTRRSAPVATELRVVETWRTGTLLDALRDVVPARVLGTLVNCPPSQSSAPAAEPGTKSTTPSMQPLIPASGLRKSAASTRPSATRAPVRPVPADAGETLALRDDRVLERIEPMRPDTTLRDAAAAILAPEAFAGAASDKVSETKPTADTVSVSKPSLAPATVRETAPLLAPAAARATDPQASAIIVPPRCASLVLAAPYEHLGVTGAPKPLQDALADYLEQQASSFADVVRIEGGPFVTMRLFVLVRDKMLFTDKYRVRGFDASGEPVAVDLSYDVITAPEQLPAEWLDPAGPWLQETSLSYQLLNLLTSAGGWVMAVLELKPGGRVTAIELGVEPLAEALQRFGMTYPAFLLAGIEALSAAEVDRAQSDEAEAASGLSGLLAVLHHDPAQRALLRPGRRYDVTVSYTSEVGRPVESGETDSDGDGFIVLTPERSFSKTYTFYTDAEPPRLLAPWMLCQFPSPGERYHFHGEPIIVVFATDDVTQLFAAYDRDLRGVVRDASFRPPQEAPEREDTVRLFAGAALQKLGGVVFSPWEQTVRRRLREQPCGEFNPDSPRHERAVLDVHMEPSSEYVFDIEAPRKSDGVVPPPPAGEIRVPLHRHGFATSRYATRQAMAEAVRTAPIQQRHLPDPAPLGALATVATDQAFDAALIAAGLGVSARPETPQVTILWQEQLPPRPFAVLIDTPEPLWRSRLEPEAERDQNGRVVAWKLVSRVWLGVDELAPTGAVQPGWHTVLELPFVRKATGTRVVTAPTITQLRDRYLAPPPLSPPPPPPPPNSYVQRIVHDTSGCRTLVLLGNGVRGRTVSLGLVRNLHPLIDPEADDDPVVLLDVFCERAPWEEPV